ncbi:glycosyltransferase family 4 protein [Leifsonia kafniensis]|uniref:glycosyltransferase family 4 protein n=1 Tax=Leifsonia kafniensis TaxID=475957 RepID=UPI0031EA1CB9
MRLTTLCLNYAPELTGIAVYTSGLAEGLADADLPVHVITGYPHYPEWRIHDGYTGLSRVEHDAAVTLTRLRHPVPRRPRLANRLVMELTFGLRAILTNWKKPDVVLLVTPALFSTGLAVLKARLSHTPTCIWVQDIYSLGVQESGTGGQLPARMLRRFERRILNSATSVVVIHDRFKRYLTEELQVSADRIDVVRNWSHVEAGDPGRRDDVRRARGWAPDDIVVLHAGNMGAKQGLENVVNASEIASAQGSKVRFVLLGDGNQRAALHALGPNPRLEFVDPLPDAEFAAVLSAADILLVNERPGLTEMSVPSKLTSYFSTGLPVIAATDAESITAEELERAGGGLRVNAGAPGALVDAAEDLGADPELAASYGVAGRLFTERTLAAAPAIEQFRVILLRLARGTASGDDDGTKLDSGATDVVLAEPEVSAPVRGVFDLK